MNTVTYRAYRGDFGYESFWGVLGAFQVAE